MKVLFGHGEHGSCDEFSHLHFRKIQIVTSTTQPMVSLSSQTADDDDCHEGKANYAYSSYPASIFDFKISTYHILFDLVFSSENYFKSPVLELQRRPPKYN